MEYQVWEYIPEENREFLRWSGDDFTLATEWADFYGNRCIVKQWNYNHNYNDILYVAGE